MFKERLRKVPTKPGSYQMYNASGQIIYVGKAKNLKNRLTSYFTGTHDYKTTKMVQSVADFDYIVTHSELEALILELDLIKEHQPRYNILLMDDKSYPYIIITDERHPKMIVSRRTGRKVKRRFGPYPNVRAARETLKLLNKLYPLRKCQTLPDEPCLYYYLGQCLAPCIKKVEPKTYEAIIQNITRFLKGDTREIIKDLESKMTKASENLEFERAQEYKETIDAIKTTTETKQAVNIADLRDRDIIGVDYDDEFVAIAILFVRYGKIHASDRRILRYTVDPIQSVIEYLGQFYRTYPVPKEIFINRIEDFNVLEDLLDATLTMPQRGIKKKLLDMAIVNAKDTLQNERERADKAYEKTFGVLDELSELLQIPTPYHIEAFDNSHTYGTYPVSSLVVFKNAKPDKKNYRKFKLEEESRQSGDTEQMEEVLYRRYRRVLMDDLPRPDLVLVDGGIQQMNAARKVLQALDMDVPLAGLVKSSDHKTHHLLDGDHNTIDLTPGTKLFTFLSTVQEEAHRFAITFHKDLRSKGLYESILDSVDGVGTKTKKKLLRTFGSIQGIKEASYDELKALNIPHKTIENIRRALSAK
ncbi:MAG: excinuclease ABC subunit UvrC [Candidatus Izemoplasmataceae bacterium]